MKDAEERPIGIAIVGAQDHAKAWLSAYRATPNVRIVGLYDPVREYAVRLAEKFEGALAFSSLEELTKHPDVLGVEVTLPPGRAVQAAAQCLSEGIAVGLRSAAVTSLQDVIYLLEKRARKAPIRLFSPALFYPPIELARRDLRDDSVGDLQTMRIRSVFGQSGRSDEPVVKMPAFSAPDFCTPEYEALPLMFLLGEVLSVHVFKGTGSAVITWVSERTPGGGRFGVYEAVSAGELIIHGPLEPLDESFEIAGTDGYLFGAGLTGRIKEAPAYSRYIGDAYDCPAAWADDDPMSSYRDAAREFADSARDGVSPRYGWKWVQMIGLLREAILESHRTGREIHLADVERDYRKSGDSADWKDILGIHQLMGG